MIALLVLAAVTTLTAGCGEQAVVSSTSIVTPGVADENVHGPADVTFAREMIPVLEQHLALRRAYLAAPGTDQRFVDLANQPTVDQNAARAALADALERWGEEAPVPADTATAGANSLEGLSGEEADTRFLEEYRATHEKAVALARTQLEDGTNPTATKLARDVERVWSVEITDIDRFLEQG